MSQLDNKSRIQALKNDMQNFVTSQYIQYPNHKTYQKFILTENTQFINNITTTYYINHTPAAQGMCLFNYEKEED